MNTQIIILWTLAITFGAVANIANYTSAEESLKVFFSAIFFIFLLLALLWTGKAAIKGG